MSLPTSVDLLLLICRAVVGGVLLVAGWAKIQAGPAWFLHALLGYDLLPRRLATPVARGLPWVEVACGLALLAGLLTPVVALVGFALMLIFAVAIGSAIVRQKPADCGCFGPPQRARINRPQWVFIYRNLVLAGLTLPVCTAGAGRLALDALGTWQLPTVDQGILWLIWALTLTATLGLHFYNHPRARASRAASMRLAAPSLPIASER